MRRRRRGRRRAERSVAAGFLQQLQQLSVPSAEGRSEGGAGARSGAGAEEGQGGVMTLLWQLSSKPLPREAESPAAGARMRAAVRRARPRTVTGG